MKKLLMILCSCLILISCSQDLDSDYTRSDETRSEEARICTELSHEEYDHAGETTERGALYTYWKWKNGQTIRIKFLNGDAFLQGKVKQYAAQWLVHANLKFQYVGVNDNADIKIAFKWNGDGGSWSYIGTGCSTIAQNKPSMNFGWFNTSTSESEFSRTIIHEFGHALGLIHEHQHPTANIPWNKPVVYSYYSRTNGWSRADVDNNIFAKYSTTQTNYSGYDKSSIMHYPIDKSLTTNGYSVGWNTVLSAVDKAFIAQMYPYSATTKGFYRYYIAPNHFYTSNYNELGNKYFEQTMGRVYSNQVANTFPIYRYYNTYNGDRLSTTNYNELKSGIGSWRYEGITGYAYKTQQANTIPVYRYYKTNPCNHFLTTSNTEVAGGKYGYKYEGIAFYILKN